MKPGNRLTNRLQLKSAIIVFLVAIVTFFSFLFKYQYVSTFEYNTEISSDSRDFLAYSYNLVNHGIYSKNFPPSPPQPDSFRSPGYPFFISFIYYFVGIDHFFAYVIYSQIFLATLIIPLTFILGRFFLSGTLSLLASLLVAICPHYTTMPSYMLSETLFSFLLVSAIILTLYGLKKQNLSIYILSGVCWGCAYLTNETVALLPFFAVTIAVWLIKKSPTPKGGFQDYKGIVAMLCIFTMFITGWWMRNTVSLKADSMTGSNRALNTLTHGSYPDFIYKDPKLKYYPYRHDPQQKEYSESLENFIRIFYSRFKERPMQYLTWYLLKKPYYIWSWSILQGRGDIYIYQVNNSLYETLPIASAIKEFMKRLHPFLLIFSFLGFIQIVRQRYYIDAKQTIFASSPILLYIVMLYVTLLYTVFAPWPRYTIPYRPELYISAVWGIAASIQQLKRLDKKRYKEI